MWDREGHLLVSKQALDLVEGEPDPAIAAVPNGLVDRVPSDLMRLSERLAGRGREETQVAGRLDAVYRQPSDRE